MGHVKDWFFQVPRTTDHLIDDEADRCVCCSCLEKSRREKEKIDKVDPHQKIPVQYKFFQQ